jgi:hypothetical protein
MGRTEVPGQLQQKKFKGPHLKGEKLGMAVHTCHPSEGREHKISRSKLAWAKSSTLSPK